ncbi:hypothetical protein J2T08_002988 [Neorhizobium galegae]|uniref:hypothetical protein n=1 Tax=Neorhizobium galegae TaxID=399 RepID=UPI002781D62E|nr:hypothetical protein [Neorhizobium galegae]MDQ0135067.1 hypothetical protein [Neorhizobium galegae]
MNANISAAIRAVPSEAREAIFNVWGHRAFWAIGLSIAAAAIAFLNYEFSGLLTSLAIGVGMVLFCGVTLIGGIASWLFFTGLFWRRSEARMPPPRIRRLADDDIPRRFWFSGFVATLLWIVPLYALALGLVSATE